MALGTRNSSVIDRRLQELQREMARLEREMKTANRGPLRPPPPPAPPPAAAAEEDLFARSAPPPPSPANPPPDGKPFKTGRQASRFGRERFANYFMAGHFQDLRPSRQEVRVLRNKAILMLVLVLLLVFWLFYYYGFH